MTPRLHFEPDYNKPPGAHIQEYLDYWGISGREFARRCGRSAKMISELIACKAPLEPETALQLQRVTAMDARIWLSLEAGHRLRLACHLEEEDLSQYSDWAMAFPLRELQARNLLIGVGPGSSTSKQVRALFAFFGVGNMAACNEKFAELQNVAYRHSPALSSDQAAVLSWLRLGEMNSPKEDGRDYNRSLFLDVLRKARELALEPVPRVLPQLQALCLSAGVVLLVQQPFGRMALSGASRWLSPRRALIQQTLRHKTADHFWFTFFHEAAHILLHSRKFIFVDGHVANGATEKEEVEANEWAAHFLIPPAALTRFITTTGDLSEAAVLAFAKQHRVAPGVVVGQLQHRRTIGYNRLNGLKEKLDLGALAPAAP